jgi:hypothetical protein
MKSAKQLQEEILALTSEQEIRAYVARNDEHIWELHPVGDLEITLLALDEVCSGAPGSFKQLIKMLSEIRSK